MKFQRELAQDVYEEMLPLFELHWQEVAHYKDIELNPDKEKYFKLEEMNALRVYTIRENDALIGYGVYFMKENPHYKQSKQAVEDIIFIRKDKRGQGREFISWCDNQLKSEGVQVVYHHVKAAHNWGKILERQGYELIDLIYGKRL